MTDISKTSKNTQVPRVRVVVDKGYDKGESIFS